MTQKQDIFNVLSGRVKFFRGAYNITSDPVWLAAFAADFGAGAKTVLDVGVGTGGAALCLFAHHPEYKITGIDVSEEMLSECARNAELNGRNIELIRADILTWRTSRTFDIVITNPPYFKGTARKSEMGNPHHNTDLYKWTRGCLRRLRPRGRFYCIAAADAAAEIIAAAYDGCAGDVVIIPLFGTKKTAERVLISARLGVKSGTTLYGGFPMTNRKIADC